ncbi:MAG TPA: hypothetical protein VK815_00170, partial [Candidatus Acidoferrales bacterium]|nr:hypothetical protein [Candidatus Acidoferrales bacterium]
MPAEPPNHPRSHPSPASNCKNDIKTATPISGKIWRAKVKNVVFSREMKDLIRVLADRYAAEL